MQIMSAALSPGMYSLADHHSGVEAIYVIKGDHVETPTRAFKLRKGETLALPGGTPFRAVVLGIDASLRLSSHRLRRGAGAHDAHGRRNRATARRMQVTNSDRCSFHVPMWQLSPYRRCGAEESSGMEANGAWAKAKSTE